MDKKSQGEQPKVSSVNLPNALTVLRIVLVPVFIWFYLMNTVPFRWWALLVFVVAGFTDQLDGHIARSWNLITDFGRLADPLADKALTLSAFILLSIDGPLPYFWVFTVLVAIRELGITWLREIWRREGRVVAADSWGKIKTVLQMLLIFLMLIPWQSFVSATAFQGLQIVFFLLALVTLGITVYSGIGYVLGAKKAGSKK